MVIKGRGAASRIVNNSDEAGDQRRNVSITDSFFLPEMEVTYRDVLIYRAAKSMMSIRCSVS